MKSSINNPAAKDVSLNQSNLSDKNYLKEVLHEEYIKYLILFIITVAIIIGWAMMLSYKMDDLEINLLKKIQAEQVDASIKDKEINMVN